MAKTIDDIRLVRADKPARIMFYGPAGIGKTTLAAEFPDPIFIQVEDGTPDGVELASFGLLTTFREVMDSIALIAREDLPFQTVVLDSVTAMQKMIFAATCAAGDEKGHAKANIEDFGYGKGYIYAQRFWDELMSALYRLRQDKGMMIVLIGHSRVERFDDPETASYDRYSIDLNDKIRGSIEREMDAILLLKSPVSIQKEDLGFKKERMRAEGGSVINIYAKPRPAFTAKNRYGIPNMVPYRKGAGYAELAKYLPPSISRAPAADEQNDQQEQ